ncbi:hypothetical protein F66182_7541 [Fusarium sp. NRRL 66182]|nr:hypothetical protein F66182_7541 [Fusarium sp. NRRL 66182]
MDEKASPPPFEYTPLDEGQIRLLQLHPAKHETENLQGELIVKSLNELTLLKNPTCNLKENHVCFEAISYVWGQATLTEYLTTPQGSIPITASLASILRRIRDSADIKIYWADGVCIDQSNVAEKEVQVSLMGLIYSSALRVLCDVGEEEEETFPLLDAIERYWKRNMRRGFLMGQDDVLVLSGEATAKVMGVTLPTDDEADKIQDVDGEEWAMKYLELMSSPWFRRLWVVQEFVLGRQVHMIFGRRRVQWGELWAGTVRYKGIEWPWISAETTPDLLRLLLSYNALCLTRACRSIDYGTTHGREFAEIARILLCGVEPHQLDLPYCLIAFSSNSCTVPRDHYFGLLGMIDAEGSEEPTELRADYTSPIRDITMRFWKYALRLPSGGELIFAAGLPGRVEGYPSWLRDITVTDPMEQLWLAGPLVDAWHRAGGEAGTWSSTFCHDDPDRMFVKGYRIDDIIETSSMIAERLSDLSTLTQRVGEALAFFTSASTGMEMENGKGYPVTGEAVDEAALKTLCNYSKQDEKVSYDEEFKDIVRIGLCLPLDKEKGADDGQDTTAKIPSLSGDVERALEGLFRRIYSTWGLRCCKTRKGLFAMLPKEVRDGDSLWILQGCRLPVALRPSATHPESVELVGGGYVYGVMNGEMLERPGFKWSQVSLR